MTWLLALALTHGVLEECRASRDARTAGDVVHAIEHAKACVARWPTEPDAFIELSRSLALAGRFEDGLDAARRAAELAPDYEAARLRAAEAERWLAGERDAAGETTRAFERLRASCAIDGCPNQERWWRRLSPTAVDVSQSLFFIDGVGATNFFDTSAEARRRVGRFTLAATARLRIREEGSSAANLGGGAGYQARGWRVDARLLGNAGGGSLPRWDARLELGSNAIQHWNLAVSARFLHFASEPAAPASSFGDEVGVLTPRACWSGRRVTLCGQGDLVLREGDALRGLGLFRALYDASTRFRVQAGAGGGNTVDFIALRNDTVSSTVLAIAGVEWLLGRMHGLTADYVARREATLSVRWIHQTSIGWALRL